MVVAILTTASLPSTTAVAADKVTFASALQFYPGIAEGYGVTKYVEALDGLFRHHPAFAGKIEFATFDRAAMFSNIAEHLEAVSTGAIQITYSNPQEMEAFEPAYKVATAPGLFRDFDHFARAVNSREWREMDARLAANKGVTVVRWVFDAGALYLFTRKPVESKADVKGQRIRYPAGESWRLALAGLGAEPLALPFTEVVSALQTNLIDGLITDFTGGVSYYSLKDFTPYAILVPISIQPIAIVANTSWWNSLSEEQRAAIQEMFDILDTSRFYDRLTDREIENWRAIADMKAVEPVDAADWRKAMQDATQSAITDVDPNLLKAIHGVE